MDRELRKLYNDAYTPDLYRRYVARLETHLGVKIPFRIAETPFFIPPALRARLAKAATEIVDLIADPALIETMSKAIPQHLDVPRRDALAGCLQIDFAICKDAQGELTGKVVELQGFASLFGLMVVQFDALTAELKGIKGLDRNWSTYYGDLDRSRFVARFGEAVLGGHPKEEVVLLDLDPPSQKTYCDFVATRMLIGVDAIAPHQIEREGARLFRRVEGHRVPIRRIYNRVVFDELARTGTKMPFDYREDLDVSWFPHPNWYWIWSKYTLPYVDHEAVPKATFLSQLQTIPDDLSRYVLKPLFSYAGSGVIIDVRRADLDAIPEGERDGWILQEKIHYEPGIVTPDGHGVKAEVRMMFLRGPHDEKPQLMLNLVRLSRGKMLGVDQNKDFDWVGGSIGMWPSD
ncbi:MAG: hypothetical protein NVS3B20_02940 [Polyangiales bacterium]